ncbi:MAG: NAD(P)H-binding protein, partial [Cyanobacteria bacterium P01_F01_bin.56]
MKLVIFGATGTVGRQVVQQALAQGHTVTAFARNLTKLNIQHSQLSVAQGDVMDDAAVEQAIRGQDAVVCVLGAGKQLKSTIRSAGTQQIIQAMEKVGLRRLICLSTIGTGDSWSNLD